MHILIIDDHELFTEGFKLLLHGISNASTVIGVQSYAEALRFKNKGINLILLDYHLPDHPAGSAIDAIKLAFPATRLIIVSSEESNTIIHNTISRGASGFIPKSSSRDAMISALKVVLLGGIYLPPQAFDAFQANPPDNRPTLTNRQSEVVSLAVKGMPNKLIADRLHIAEGTVKAHLFSAFRVMGVSNRTEAVMAAAKYGVDDPREPIL